jgi:hypothetical protein
MSSRGAIMVSRHSPAFDVPQRTMPFDDHQDRCVLGCLFASGPELVAHRDEGKKVG